MNYLTYLMDTNDVALLLLGICIIPIAILLIIAIVLRIVKARKKAQERAKNETVDEGQKDVFFEAYGGSDNVLSVEIERNKIKVKTNDIEKVDGEKLKELGATGVLLVGDEVRASFGDRAEEIYELIKKEQ